MLNVGLFLSLLNQTQDPHPFSPTVAECRPSASTLAPHVFRKLKPRGHKVMSRGNRNAYLQTPIHSCYFRLPLSEAPVLLRGDRARAGVEEGAWTLARSRQGSKASLAIILFTILNQIVNASQRQFSHQ